MVGQSHLQADERLPEEQKIFQEFSIAFAGQGRTRWHYGVAHSILADIEDSGVKASSRGWFFNDERVRDNIILGCSKCPTGFHYLSLGEFQQAGQAFLVVKGTLAGAFTLAYCTPTYGLGCRSGNLMIFMTLILYSFLLEILFWTDIDRQYQGIAADYVDLSPDRSILRRLVQGIVDLREPIFVFVDFAITGCLFYIVWAQTDGA